MPTFEFTAPDGKSYEVGAPEGATQAQAFEMLQGQLASGSAPAAKEPSAIVSAGRAINDIPRQLGLTARYALTGPAKAAQVVTEPLRYLTDKVLPDRQQGLSDLVTGRAAPPKSTPLGVQAEKLADTLGLPRPQTPLERTVGDATELVAGAGGSIGALSAAPRAAAPALAEMATGKLANAATALRAAPQALIANPASQLAGAAGAGLAGGASREAGGTPGAQTGAALIGGIAGSFVPGAVGNTVRTARNLLMPTPPAQLDVTIAQTLQRAGTDWSQLPPNVKAALRTEAATALRTGRELDPTALDRLATIRAVGATPTRGMVTQDPVLITREQNLAKTGANSADAGLQGLARVQNENNQALIGRLNDIGGRTETDPIAAGRLVASNITGTRDALRSVEQGAWSAAKGSPGYKAPISNEPVNAAFRAVDEEALLGFLPKQITDYMQAFQNGSQPFTPQHYQNLRSMLSGELEKGGNEAKAARAAVQALEGAQMRPITNPGGVDFGTAPVTGGVAAAMRARDAAPGASVDAVDRARRATAAAYGFEDSSPLVRSVLADARSADPERIAQSFILSGSVNDAQQVAQAVGPQGRETIKNALATHIKRQALSGAADETGKVSQSALNAAIRKVGEEKLRLFFSPEEIATLKNAGRAASLMQSQPIGSAVNNSNSGALLLGRGLDVLDRLPVIGPMTSPAIRNIETSIRQRQAQNVAPVLLRPQAPAAPAGSPLLLPGLAIGGGLLSPPQQ